MVAPKVNRGVNKNFWHYSEIMENDFRKSLTLAELKLAESYVTLGGANISTKRAKKLCEMFATRLPRHGFEVILIETTHEKLILKHESGKFNLRIWTSPNIHFK